MIKLQDFLDRGYVIEETLPLWRRRLSENEPESIKAIDIAQSLKDTEDFTYNVSTALRKEFGNNIVLGPIYWSGNNISDVVLYKYDETTRTVRITKGTSKFVLLLRIDDDSVVFAIDTTLYAFESNAKYVMGDDETFDHFLSRFEEDRDAKRKEIMYRYNNEIRKLKKEYRETLQQVKNTLSDL